MAQPCLEHTSTQGEMFWSYSSPVSRRIADVVRHRDGAHAAIRHQPRGAVPINERECVIRRDDVVVSVKRGMHLIALKGHQFAVILPRHLGPNLVPVVQKLFKALPVKIHDKFRLRCARIDVRPHGVSRNAAEIQMAAGDLQRILQASETIGDAAVVM